LRLEPNKPEDQRDLFARSGLRTLKRSLKIQDQEMNNQKKTRSWNDVFLKRWLAGGTALVRIRPDDTFNVLYGG
jgi:hypothetical protein